MMITDMNHDSTPVQEGQQLFGRKELRQIEENKKAAKIATKIDKAVNAIGRLTNQLKKKPDYQYGFDRSRESLGTLPDAEFDGLRIQIENPQIHEKYGALVAISTQKIKEAFPEIDEKTYAEFHRRLEQVKSRFIALSRTDISIFENAYKNQPLDTYTDEEGIEQIAEYRRYLACYDPFGDFIVLPANVDETAHGSIRFIITEEILHFTNPFSDELLAKVGYVGQDVLNEGAARYYLTRVHAGETLPPRMTTPYDSMYYTFVGEILWKTWVKKYGEQKMADVFFGHQDLPLDIDLEYLVKNGPIDYLTEIEHANDSVEELMQKRSEFADNNGHAA